MGILRRRIPALFALSLLTWSARGDQFFSGIILEVTGDKITVTRTVLGNESDTRTFLITPETRIEGKPSAKSRVTVRYVPSDAGDRAVHIIVRSN